ncbi:MAG: dinitrogenase iron-molybdenum cofactor biosynthesis protein [Proteobacteria bacterium]|nr:dinitrogenase iron-molybdenum cofactor biosynthesis protein [Pseudomonadota bacterium]
MIERILIPLYGDDVAPRFDMATDVMIATFGPGNELLEKRTVVLQHASPDKLCQLILTGNINAVICGGIEEEYFQYLTWKKIRIIDSVIGEAGQALELLRKDNLHPGQILINQF